MKESTLHFRQIYSLSHRLCVLIPLLRLSFAFLSLSWFVPDETWQSVEVSHSLAFGYGNKTWEWESGIRSFAHPLLFLPFFTLLRIAKLDSYLTLLTTGPRVIAAIFSCFGDIFTLSYVKGSENSSTFQMYTLLYLFNWFLNYTSSRTLINTLEMNLTSMTLYLLSKSSSLNNTNYIFFLSCLLWIRPTAMIFFCPLVFFKIVTLLQSPNSKTSLVAFSKGLLTLFILCCLDRVFYGYWVLVPLQFFLKNIVEDRGSFYGQEPFTYYITNGLPSLLTLSFPLLLLYIISSVQKFKITSISTLSLSLFVSLFIFSLIPHKEFRFLLPLLPSLLIYPSRLLSTVSWRRVFLSLYIPLNIILAYYFSCIHQVGPFELMGSLEDNTLVLLPCHSLPYQSHLHNPSFLKLTYLNCDFERDETEAFYSDPYNWLRSLSHNYSFLIFFDTLLPTLSSYLKDNHFEIKKSFFHSHFPSGRIGSHILLFSRSLTEK